ncbi:hypothetical protein ACJJTC_003406 [Scirpophaga incertulas]
MVFDDNVLEPASPLLSALPEHTRGRSDDALEGEYIAIADRRPRRNIRRPDRGGRSVIGDTTKREVGFQEEKVSGVSIALRRKVWSLIWSEEETRSKPANEE